MGTSTPTAQRPADTKDATSPATASPKKPVAVFRFENVSAAAFIDREPKTEGGKPLYNISLTRSYRDESGKWVTTHTLWPSDLLAAALALQKCYEFVHEGTLQGGQSA